MSAPAILIVEDNAITRKLFRLVVEGEGFVAVEAATGASALEKLATTPIQLVLLDMVLPDMSGFELARRLRSLPGGTETPVVALSGFLHLLDNARQRPEVFDAFLFKPIESDRLIDTIRTYLPRGAGAPESATDLRPAHVLIVDDDPVQLKLARLHLARRFSRVTTAGGGAAALVQAREDRPDVILSDVLMPGMDGFELCMALRQDHLLTAVAVVLVSAHYDDTADHELARRVGASALLPRQPDFAGVADRISDILDRGPRRPASGAAEPAEDLHRDHVSRARLQLERQLALNAGQARRAALQSAQLSILSGVANALTGSIDVDAQLDEVLASCLDAAGITRAVLYRTPEGGAVRVSHTVGYGAQDRADLEQVFGHPDLLDRATTQSVALPIAAPALDPAEATHFLSRAGLVSACFIPLQGGGQRLGAVLLGSNSPALEPLQIDFCRAMTAYIGQALALAEAFAREQAARQAAEQASRAKTTFLSLVSHELLTPLTSIRLQIDRLERSDDGLAGHQLHILGQLARAEGRLHDLVDALLEHTRIESGYLEITPEPLDAVTLLREVVEDLQPRAQTKGLLLRLLDPGADPPIRLRTDRRLLRLIGSNLIDNAIKFTDAGRVEVSLTTDGSLFRLTVADTGRGIPPEDIARIFVAFEQLERIRHKHTPGVGLGLALVKRLAEVLGGTVEVSSQLGVGSRFTVSMPELAAPVALQIGLLSPPAPPP
jgi:signal transduction histidine kinase/PleD family two-component response regulator